MESDITKTTTTSMDTLVDKYSPDHKSSDGPGAQKESEWAFPDFTENYGYYYDIYDARTGINKYAEWVLGRGWESAKKDVLNNIIGWGEDTFDSIMWNMLVVKKFAGDAFAEVIRNEVIGPLINLKVLTPERMKIKIGNDGLIERYEYRQADGKIKKLQPNKVLHLVNDRVLDNIHGSSVIPAIKWLIDAKQEAMRNWRKISHRSSVRILYIDESDTTRLDNIKRDYPEAIKKGELLILPIKAGEAKFEDLTLPPVESFLAWIRYIDTQIAKAIGIPKVIQGDSEGTTESGSKVAYQSHEPTYLREVKDLEDDIWNQLAVRIKFNRAPSLMDGMQATEAKNTAQTGFQPQDKEVGNL